ncbi:UDP-N-acetylmuramate--L-alanine ligase [Flavihumibacter petaseus]|uniref:UDP-N-acetylmuramate--L-alanine ligase n=1 Tax=Flavihumibacter petaseus NBRC 106054 TaxID=1220578 RepID=A0A0E9N6I6_9BACT|nr:UDP-N-acetylmuramate--L-alanine ligase [Flavihumibacter petaseus]GAO44955.1 UDP-N-acetylmuramate--L-alanine ligase [Flavihumibacter petaseus NBRC 106054]
MELLSVKDIQTVYFIGIGGIGMSALARYFHSYGKKVSGYDKTPTPLTDALQQEGIAVHFVDDIGLLPQNVDLVVYTPAVPVTHQELNHFRQLGTTIMKRSEVLGVISRSSFNICIGGTHGKTTTTTMTAHVLRYTGYGCNAFLGGISVNYNTNFWSDSRNVSVIEADEYDRSFLQLHPDIAVISSMDPDHLDIYGTEEALQDAFIDFSKKLKPGGTLLSKFGLPRGRSLEAPNHLTYSLQNDAADIYAVNISMHDGSYRFDVVLPGAVLNGFDLHMGGLHNVENALVAIAIAHQLGIEESAIKAAIAAFKGVKRRFEYVVKNSELVYIDDYAHHPEELKALLKGARTLFPERKCTIIFQPHLFTRTRDLADGFAASLDLADEVILLPIYPARELPIPGVTSEMILERLRISEKQLMDKDAVLQYIKDKFLPAIRPDFRGLLITAGAGDIDTLVHPIETLINDKW